MDNSGVFPIPCGDTFSQSNGSDLSDDIRDKLPPKGDSNGKRIACVGAAAHH